MKGRDVWAGVGVDGIFGRKGGVGSGLICGSAPWLYRPPPPSCPVKNMSTAHLVANLYRRVGYLGPVNRNKVEGALELALSHEKSVPRLLGENLAVAAIVADMQMDVSTVCAAVLRGLLHDAAEVEAAVGRDVGTILRVHADVAALVTTTQHEAAAEGAAADFFGSLRECILLAANVDRRAVSVELAAAVVDTRKLGQSEDDAEKTRIARRAMNLYAPLANRMGIYFIQSELEELAFMYLQPEPFRALSRDLAALTRESQDVLAENKAALDRALSTAPVVRGAVRSVAVKGRIKGVYSCYRKVLRTGRPLSELYDLLALRVIVQARGPDPASQAAAVFAVADAVKENFCVVPARAKDYVSHPKPNGYRSLHLTVAHPGARPGLWTPLEIQIRTELMDRVAEFGSAAHWLYKEDGSAYLVEGGDAAAGDDAPVPGNVSARVAGAGPA